MGPFAPVWSDLSRFITEVIINGEPVLEAARKTVRESGAPEIIARVLADAAGPERAALGERLAAVGLRYARPR